MNPPSGDARELVRGGVDLHLHIAPDVIERRIDDVSLARRFEEVGLAGFVLKSHYVPTAERAAVVRGVVPGVQVLGAIALNRSVGGMNPLAVEIAAREGARTVWFPTVDAENETAGRTEPEAGRQAAGVGEDAARAARAGRAVEPVPVVDKDGAVLPETRAVLQTIARHGLLLATGHLGARRDLRGGRRRRRGGRARHRRDASRVPLAGPEHRGPDRARAPRRVPGALLHDAGHGQVHVGALARGHAGGRPRVHRCSRPTWASSTTRRSRTACR